MLGASALGRPRGMLWGGGGRRVQDGEHMYRPTHTLPSSHAQHSGGEGESPSKAPPPVGFFYWGHSLPVFSAVALQPQISFNVKSSLGPKGFPGGSGKTPTCQGRRHSRRGFNLWVRKIPWRRTWQPTPIHSTLVPREFHGQRRLAGYRPWGRKKSDVTKRLSIQ